MADREQIILELESDISRAEAVDNEWVDCIRVNTLKKVIELLKEQEAKEQCLKTKCIIYPHCDNCDVDENGLLKEQELQREYEAAVEDQQYCERYEPTYNPDDGSM